jgi:hypothetical protein
MINVFCKWVCGLTNTLKRLKNVGFEEVEYISKYKGRREFVSWHK